MIRIITTKRLRQLESARDASTRLAERNMTLCVDADVAQHGAAAAEAEARQARAAAEAARADYQTLYDSTVAKMADLARSTRDEGPGEQIRGALALRILRDHIADAKREGATEEERKSARVLEALLGDGDAQAELATSGPGIEA